MEKKFGALSSSVNPEQLSLLVTSLTRMVLTIAAGLGYATVVQVDGMVEQVPVIVAAGFATYDALQALYGAVRKVIVTWTQK